MEQLGTCDANVVYSKDPHVKYPGCVNWKPLPVPAEPVKYHAPSSLVANGICSEENFMTREQRNAAEPVAGETHLELCQCRHSRGLHTKAGACGVALCDCRKFAGETKPDKVQSALRGIRDIVKGRCNHLDLEVIREIINEAIGHEQV